MKRKLYSLIFIPLASIAFADDVPVINANSTYINPRNFLENPYGSLTSGGGTQNLVESQVATQNIMEKWFADGTWNVWGTSSFSILNGLQPTYQYGANIFGQTGQVAGFSIGGLLTVMNPYFANQMNPAPFSAASNQFQPSNEQVTPSEAFLEYQYSNRVQVDAGYIGITNSPWLGSNYYNNMAAPAITYQGLEVNVNPGGGWVLSAIGFNAAQPSGQVGFDRMTLYNTGFDWATGTSLTSQQPSAGTVAFGANYMAWDNNENLRIWSYNFNNYAALYYVDNSTKFVVNKDLSFTLQEQFGKEYADHFNTIQNNGLGTPGSTFFGVQGGFTYKWLGLNLAFNNADGGSGSFGNGAIVSPYTYGVALDPLYTTPYMQGLVDRASGGQAYKIAPTLSFLDGNLSIAPAYTLLETTAVPSSQEYDLVVSYSVPQVKGLSFFGAYAYQSIPYTTVTNSQGTSTYGSTYTTMVFASYLY